MPLLEIKAWNQALSPAYPGTTGEGNLRRWDGNLVSVPNSQFADYQLDSYDDVGDIFIRRRPIFRREGPF